MQVALENNIVFVVIEYLAILCWGLSGGLAAIRKGYDIFTIMLCGWLTALGGGLVRDVMLGALPPVGITDKGYVLTTLFSGIIVVVAHPEHHQTQMDDDCHRCSGPRTIRSQRHRKSSGLRFLRHDSRIPWHVHSTGRRPHS